MEFRRSWKSALWGEVMPVRTHSKFLGVQQRTIRLYKREVSLFSEYLRLHEVDLPSSYEALDALVGEYINHLFQEGEAISKAGWLLSGLRRFVLRLRRELCLAQQWFTNWSREHTPSRATPLPLKVVLGMAGFCYKEAWYHLGVSLLLGFAFFLRAQELLTLRWEDIERNPSDGAIILRLQGTKTSKQHLQALALTHPQLLSLVQKAHQSTSSPWLWPSSTSHFRNCFQSLRSFFELTDHHFVLFSLRRGGATHFYQQMQTLDFVMVQGRWKDQRACRLYLDDARAMLVNFHLSATTTALLMYFVFFISQVASPKPIRGEVVLWRNFFRSCCLGRLW